MLARWHTWALRAPISTSATGRRRERMQSIQFWRWLLPMVGRRKSRSPSGGCRIDAGVDEAAHVDAPGGPSESAVAHTAVEHLDAVGVDEAQSRLAALRRMDFGRGAVVHVERPLRDVEVVRSHVGQEAAGVFAIVAPGRE